MSSAMPISSLKCTWTRLSALRLQLGLGCRSIRRARRLPRNLGGGWEMACPSLSGGQRQSLKEGQLGIPSSRCLTFPPVLRGLAQLSQNAPEDPTPNLSLRSDCHRPRTAHRGPPPCPRPLENCLLRSPKSHGAWQSPAGDPHPRLQRDHGGTRTLSLPGLPSPLFLVSCQVAPLKREQTAP